MSNSKKDAAKAGSDPAALIMAAGGIVERRDSDPLRIAVIHRDRYDDWSLPKGKQEPGEEPEETARREVHEETGCRVRCTGFAGCLNYQVKGRPKVVLYWMMAVEDGLADFQPSEEVGKINWLTPADALARITYEEEKKLLRQVYHLW